MESNDGVRWKPQQQQLAARTTLPFHYCKIDPTLIPSSLSQKAWVQELENDRVIGGWVVRFVECLADGTKASTIQRSSVPGDHRRLTAVVVQHLWRSTCRSRRHARRVRLLWRMRLTETAMDIHDCGDDHNPDNWPRNYFQTTPPLCKAGVHTSAYPRPQHSTVPNPPLPCLSPTWLLQTLRVTLPITTKSQRKPPQGFPSGNWDI